MADITLGMVDPWGQVVRECAGPKLPLRSVALTYAFGIRQAAASAGVRDANEALARVYGEKGRDRVKALAWDFVEGRRDVVTGKRVPRG